MSVIATDTQRFSNVVKREFEPTWAYCREVVTVNDAAATLQIGAVLGKFIASPTGTAAAVAGNTGTGTMSAVTVTAKTGLQLGTYKVTIVKAASNAGDFVVTDPQGGVVGYGTVGVAYSQGGIAFTLSDATDFIVGDAFTIVIGGTYKYKLVEATATDGSENAVAVVVGDATGKALPTVVALNTDTKFLALVRGPAIVGKAALQLGASVDQDAEKAAVYASLASVGILANDQL